MLGKREIIGGFLDSQSNGYPFDSAALRVSLKNVTLMSSTMQSLPYLTADLPGTGGRLKVSPEDFVVEEIPAYEPSGEGQHLYLWLEKRDLPHDVMLRRLSKLLEVSSNEIGVAGIKDRRAITRQYVSVPISCASRIEQLESDELHVLRSVPHVNKLRTGHLRGNRFTIIARDVRNDASQGADAIASVLTRTGFPNYYGEQRFGHDGETLNLGLDLLAGRKSPRDIPFQKRKFLLRLALSAVQSDLFNQALGLRLRDGLLRTVLDGDVLEVIESGGKFVSEDVAAEQTRLDQGELSVTGPMFGVKMLSPRGLPAEREAELLGESGLNRADFEKFANLLSGARRSYLIRPTDLKTKPVDLEVDVSINALNTGADPASLATTNGEIHRIQFEFSLPSGSYATMLLREFMKNDENPNAQASHDDTNHEIPNHELDESHRSNSP